MNSIKSNVNLKEEVKEMFDVSMWWYELHGGKVQVVASSKEEAMKLVKENMSKYIELAKKQQETYSGSNGEEGIDDAILIENEEENKSEIYEDRFDKDVYITTTSYHSLSANNILEIGKVKYRDYIHGEKPKYKFSETNIYIERFNYYNVGACPNRQREGVLFEKDDYSKLLSKSFNELDYIFAKSIEEALDKGRYILMMERHCPEDSKPRTLQIRAVKIKKESERVPFKIHIMDNQYIGFNSREEAETRISSGVTLLGYNNSRFNLFLNTTEGLRMLNETVIESIGYTFE